LGEEYIKDGDTVWNPMGKPMRLDLDNYECRHGLGYTIIKGELDAIEVTVTFFVPLGARHEVWKVDVRNISKIPKSIRLLSYVEWCLWDAYDDMTNFQRNFSIGEVEVEKQAIFHVTEYRERRNHYAYFASSHPVTGFDTSRDIFMGVHKSLRDPKTILKGECNNSIAFGWSPIATFQLDLTLNPQGKKNLFFLLGYAENPQEKKYVTPKVINKAEFVDVFKQYNTDDTVEEEFNYLKNYWTQLLAGFQTTTENSIVNRMVNIWNLYQCMITFNISRSASFYESGIGRGMGYRDSHQDILGFAHMIPDRARKRILDLASTQLSNGTSWFTADRSCRLE
jgi:cellobiose phosphorylase